MAPHQALALSAVITYMDSVNGVFTAKGGMHAVPAAMATAAHAAGVEIRYNSKVERIVLRNGTSGEVTGVRLADDSTVGTNRVVCTADLPVAYRTMLPGIAMPRVARRGNYSPSALVWHVGVKGEMPAEVAHHNIHFGAQWRQSFKSLLSDGERMADPSILISVPTVDDASLAPPDRHVLYVLEPVPNLDGKVDWQAETPWRGLNFWPTFRPMSTRPRSRPSTWSAPTSGIHKAWNAVRHSRCRTSSCRRVRSARPTSSVAPPVWCSPAAAPCLASVSPWCWSPASSPPSECSNWGPHDHLSRTVSLEESYKRCKELNKRYGTTYYWSTFALPRIKRHHVWALYAFCR